MDSQKGEQKIEENQIKIGKYSLIQKLGSGGFSSVYLCEDENQNKFALKKIREVKERYIQQELKALMTIKSPYIVKYVENFVYKEYPIIIMEYCEQGTLDSYLKLYEGGVMQEKKALNMFANILQGIRAIHEAGFIHRDLKGSNILMQNGQPKISDFGLARKATTSQMIQSNSCTPSYAAPEVLQGKQYGYKVDIWSLGVILYKMLFGCLPFEGSSHSKLIKKIQDLCQGGFQISKAPKKKTQDISLGLIKLFKEIFVIDYQKRIGFKELYQNSIIQDQLINYKDTLEFYEIFEQKNDELDVLQSIIKNNENEEEDEEELKRRDSLEREDAMITSILVQQKNDSSIQEQAKNYTALINLYGFLIDNYIFFNQKINFMNGTVNKSNFLLLKFFLSKLIYYYIKNLKKILSEKENVFNLSFNFAQFTFSKTYRQMEERLKMDEQIWSNEFETQYSQVQQLKQEKYPNIKQYFDETLNETEKYYEKLPDDIKLPFRAVIMTNLKTFYHSILYDNQLEKKLTITNKTQQNQQKNTKTKHQLNNPNIQKTAQQSETDLKNMNNKLDLLDLSPPPQLGKQLSASKFIQLEKDVKATIMLRLALCASWNRIFSINNVYTLNGNQLKYDQLITILHKSNYEQCIKQTQAIMEQYFPNLKNFDYNFM
ncbi:hypothetical protein ABPG73_013594 [Tetrahymena malaccensis]